MVLIIGVAVVGVSTGRGLWEWSVYSGWGTEMNMHGIRLISPSQKDLFPRPLIIRPVFRSGANPEGVMSTRPTTYHKVRKKRWSWMPGPDEIRIEIRQVEYEALGGTKWIPRSDLPEGRVIPLGLTVDGK